MEWWNENGIRWSFESGDGQFSLAGLPSNDANDYCKDYNPDNGQNQLLFPSLVLKIKW